MRLKKFPVSGSRFPGLLCSMLINSQTLQISRSPATGNWHGNNATHKKVRKKFPVSSKLETWNPKLETMNKEQTLVYYNFFATNSSSANLHPVFFS
jgi:hypothetical protein